MICWWPCQMKSQSIDEMQRISCVLIIASIRRGLTHGLEVVDVERRDHEVRLGRLRIHGDADRRRGRLERAIVGEPRLSDELRRNACRRRASKRSHFRALPGAEI